MRSYDPKNCGKPNGGIDLEAGIWKIAASKMTMREPHMVPLSRYGIAMLQVAQAVTGRHRYVFASL